METVEELKIKVPWGIVAAKAQGSPLSLSPPVLLVHGTLDNAGAFTRLLTLLPKSYYYVSIDLPGHGFSSHFPNGLPLEFFNYVLTIRYVIGELKWDTFFYIGHSLGAILGMMFSVIYPNKIRKLICLDAVFPDTFRDIVNRIREVHTVTFNLINDPPQNALKYTRDEILYYLQNMRNFCLNSKAAEAIFERSVTKVSDDQYRYNRDIRISRNWIRPMLNVNQIVDMYRQFNCKCLIIIATASTESVYGQQIKKLLHEAQYFPNTRLVFVPGNHDVHNNYPERVSDYIINYLKEIHSKL